MDDIDTGETSHQDFVTFNGADVRIDELLGNGVLAIGSARDDYELDAAADFAETDDDENLDDGRAVLDVLDVSFPKQRETLADILSKRPTLKALRSDEEFHNVTEDGLVRKKILQPGAGRKVTPDARVVFHYAAFYNDCTTSFDSTVVRKRRACTINLEPPGDVVMGLWYALKTMEVMEIAQIVVHHSYGYLSLGCAPRVPGKATLIYNVKMLSYTPLQKLTVSQLSFEERSRLPFSKIVEAAKDLRRTGNGQMQSQEWRAAIRSYRRATDILDDYSTTNSEDNLTRCELLSTLYVNIGKAYLRLNSPEPCCVACKRGLELRFRSETGVLLRTFAKAKLMLHSHQEALNLVQRARKFGKEQEAGCNLLEKEINEKIAQEKKNEALMAQAMLGLTTK